MRRMVGRASRIALGGFVLLFTLRNLVSIHSSQTHLPDPAADAKILNLRVQVEKQNSELLLGKIADKSHLYEQLRNTQVQLQKLMHEDYGTIMTNPQPPGEELNRRAAQRQQVVVPKPVHYEHLDQKGAPPDIARKLLSADRIAVLVIAYNRADYLDQALSSLYSVHPGGSSFPVFVSQDGEDEAVANVIRKHGAHRMVHERRQLELPRDLPQLKKYPGYAYLCVHYGWAIRQLFAHSSNFEGIIILEEDIEVGSDFFGYFNATAPLLYQDPSLLCVSAYSDNGQPRYVEDHARLFRSDFFPGLGWLLSRQLWLELEPKWPENRGYWDDWLREPPQRRGRASIRPEVSRTRTFGEKGTSKSQFYRKFLKTLDISKVSVAWEDMNVSYLLKDEYDVAFSAEVDAASDTSLMLALEGPSSGNLNSLRVGYDSPGELKKMCQRLQIMDDLKAGIPRTAYHGVVTLRANGRLLHLTPTYTVEQEIV